MKKFLAVLLTAVLLLSVGASAVSAVAASAPSCGLHFGTDTNLYMAGGYIDVSVAIRDIDYGEGNGVSALTFLLKYDTSLVTLKNVPTSDDEGVECDFSAMLSESVKDWDALGVVVEDGVFDFGCTDISGKNVATLDDELVVTMRFDIKDTTKIEDITFELLEVVVYDKDVTNPLYLNADPLTVYASPQASTTENLPSDAITIDYAGYMHPLEENYNFVFYSEEGCYIFDYVYRYINPVGGQDKLTNFAVIIANSNNRVTDINLQSGDKAIMRIPAQSYILVIDLDNTADVKAVKDIAVGDVITLYNLNIKGAGKVSEALALTKVGFTFADGSSVIDPPDDPDDPIDPPIDPDPPVDPDPVILYGDVNNDKKIDKKDYALLKRYCFGAADLDIDALLAANVNHDTAVDKKDYALLKRYCFGAADINQNP